MSVKFRTKHIIMLSKIVSKMDLTLDLKGKTQEELGAGMLVDIFKGVHKAEPELYSLLSDLTGRTVEAIADMDVKDLYSELKVVATELINFIRPPVV